MPVVVGRLLYLPTKHCGERGREVVCAGENGASGCWASEKKVLAACRSSVADLDRAWKGKSSEVVEEAVVVVLVQKRLYCEHTKYTLRRVGWCEALFSSKIVNY